MDRLRELGAIAVSLDAGAKSKWLPEHASLLRGRQLILWPDSDAPGEEYIAGAMRCLRDVATSIKVVRPFGLPNGEKGRDVCDWQGDAEALTKLAERAESCESRAAAAANGEMQFSEDGLSVAFTEAMLKTSAMSRLGENGSNGPGLIGATKGRS